LRATFSKADLQLNHSGSARSRQVVRLRVPWVEV